MNHFSQIETPTTSNANMTIGQLAKAADVHVETVRYYQKRGLLSKPAKPPQGATRYSSAALARIRFIKSAQHLSFSLDDIGALLQLSDNPTDKAQARALSNERLAQVQDTRRHLDFIEGTLQRWVAECEASDAGECCPILAHIQQPDFK